MDEGWGNVVCGASLLTRNEPSEWMHRTKRYPGEGIRHHFRRVTVYHAVDAGVLSVYRTVDVSLQESFRCMRVEGGSVGNAVFDDVGKGGDEGGGEGAGHEEGGVVGWVAGGDVAVGVEDAFVV